MAWLLSEGIRVVVRGFARNADPGDTLAATVICGVRLARQWDK